MPYASNDELPPEVRKAYSGRCQTVFREAFNGHDGSEESKFKVAHTAARKCMESTMTHQPMKAEQISSSKWKVLAIPFGGPLEGKDTDGEFFSPRTDIKPDWFDRRPLLWHHGKDESMSEPLLGTVDDLEQKKDGWWVTAWLNRSNRYWAEINSLLGKGRIFGSSQPLASMVKTNHRTGEIMVWPYVEETFTPTPANFWSIVAPSKIIDHLTEAEIGLPPAFVKAALLSDLEDVPADLRTDLPPEGGDDVATPDDEAIKRLQDAVAQLEALIKRL